MGSLIATKSCATVWAKLKGDVMSIFWYRRIMALVVIILATIGMVNIISFLGDSLQEEFHCKQAIQVVVESGDTTSGIASEQVQSGNCSGYQPLTDYLVVHNGTSLRPGQTIQIPISK
jgi:cell division protein YceG involved in septum cleavage